MGLFKYVGDEVSDFVEYVHPDLAGESRKSFEPGEHVEAAVNPDPDAFVEAQLGEAQSPTARAEKPTVA